MRALGLDFGTTNTVLSWAHSHGAADPVVFQFLTLRLFSFRSALCFWDEGDESHPQVMSEAGPWAIQKFIEASGECRFIQSLKTFAASRLFESTGIFGRAFKFEDLFGAFFKKLRLHATPQLDPLPRDLLVGRPVQYAGSRPDAALARKRYELALAPFGFERIRQVTGGSSFVPAVRRIFERRFGAGRVESGNEFVSIANGLASIGLREDVDSWVVA